MKRVYSAECLEIATQRVRSVLVVFLPPAFAEVMNVATKGAIVIRPSR
jgi:hypothetical protein